MKKLKLFLILSIINGFAFGQCDPAVTIVLIEKLDVSCNGMGDAFIQVSVSGGTAPYVYNWSSGGSDSLETNLSAGAYTLIVTDFNGCADTADYVIEEPMPLEISLLVNDVACFGENNGSVTANVNGGNGGFSYEWDTDPPMATKTISNLTAGEYSVVVTDLKGCVDSSTAWVNQPDSLFFTINKTDVSCNGLDNAFIIVNADGGTSNYYYSINDEMYQTANVFAGLSAGGYKVSVKDFNECVISDSVYISEPPLLEISTNIIEDVKCFGESNGSIEFDVGGGREPYSYYLDLWPIDSTSLGNLTAGTYEIMATDSVGCSDTISIAINQPDSIYIEIPVADTVFFAEELEIVPDYNSNSDFPGFLWEGDEYIDCNTCGDVVVSPVSDVIYKTTLMDENGCTASDSMFVFVIPEKKILIPNAFTPNGDGKNDVFYVYTRGEKDFLLQIYTKWGNLVFESNDINEGWNGDGSQGKLQFGTYLYVTKVVYLDGETITKKGALNLIK